jgi:LmbE family N-acetylglucosaminyl deacetylase
MEHVATGEGDLSQAGTPEIYWAGLEATPWTPPPGPLVVLAPHPDDETLGAGGLMYTWATVHHFPVTIISVTDGEAACPENADSRTIRRHELDVARHDLSRGGIDVVHLGLPDGQLKHHRNQLLESLLRLTPENATIVAPFELDGHPDHNATGEVAWQLARQRKATLAEYPIWAWHHATPVIFNDLRLGRFELSPAAQEAKHNAIHRFHSQLRERPGGPIIPPSVLEHFHRPYEIFVLQ